MSSIVLPSRGQCIQITDSRQPCQCLWFFPPESPLLDQHICGRCGHGIHAHVDYISMFVHQCGAMSCAAYYPKTARVQACTCSASLIEHMPVVNVYRSPTPLPYVNTSTGDATNIPFTPVPMPSPSTNDSASYSYRDVVIFAPSPQPVIQTTITQIDAHPHSEVENFYIAQYQNDNPSVVNNVPDSGARFREDYSTTYVPVYGAEA